MRRLITQQRVAGGGLGHRVAPPPPRLSTRYVSRCASSKRSATSGPGHEIRHLKAATVCRAAEAGSGNVEDFVLPAIRTPEDLEEERRWLATQITTWLDEEWTPLHVHAEVGRAAADAFCQQRASGEREVGALLLGMSSTLLGFSFKETFTGAFEVANKVVELVMMRTGCDVCCTSEADRERMDRVSLELLKSQE